MPYVLSYYNYQIAVIFGILIAAVFILFIIIFVLYSAFKKKTVKEPQDRSMYMVGEQDSLPRPDKDYRMWQNENLRSPYGPMSPPGGVEPLSIAARTPTQASYPFSPQQYQPQPLVQTYRPETNYSNEIRELQPDLAFQRQGPTSWTTMAPPSNSQTIVHAQPSYHMSAV
uniref:RCR2 n=1 Tax=Rhabditophanes sp. KR3021 TaxID=114890 RepID=A0AC35TPP9_9BILA